MTGVLSSIAKAVKPNGTASHANGKPSPIGSKPTSTPVEQLKQAVNGHTAPSERDRLLAQLSSEEKIALLSGDDMWHTVAVPRLDIPRVRVSGLAVLGIDRRLRTTLCSASAVPLWWLEEPR
jgi:hypothetical protein